MAARPARVRLSARPRHAAVHALFPRRRLAARPARQRGDAAWRDLRRGAPARRSRARSGRWHSTPACTAAFATSDCSVAPLARYLGNPGLLPSHKLVATAAMASRPALQAGDDADADRRTARRRRRVPLHRLRPLHPPLPRGARPRRPVDGRARRPRRRRPSGSRRSGCRHGRRWRGPRPWRRGPGQPPLAGPDAVSAPLSADRRTFSRCVQCQTCTNVCPVVAHGIDCERWRRPDAAAGDEPAAPRPARPHAGFADGLGLRHLLPVPGELPGGRARDRHHVRTARAGGASGWGRPPRQGGRHEVRAVPGLRDPVAAAGLRDVDARRARATSASRWSTSRSAAAAIRPATSAAMALS